MSQELTQEQMQADVEKRVKAFNEEFVPLLKKYRLVPGSQAVITPDGRIASRFVVVPEETVKKDGEDSGIEKSEE